MRAGGDWWLQASELVSEISRHSSGTLTSACYRFGNLCLKIDANYNPLLDELRLWYSECVVAGARPPDGVLTRWSIRTIDNSSLLLVSFQAPASFDRAFALSIFNQLRRTPHVV